MIFGASWRTSLAGYVFALAQVLYPIFAAGRWPTNIEWGLAIVTAILGRTVKDAFVSGTDKKEK